jgi:hypothetical protein
VISVLNKYFSNRQGKLNFVWKGTAVSALVLSLGMLLSVTANAQDKIIRKDGTEVHAKVLGVDSKYIRYKRFSNQNGPDYFIFRSEVSKIEYENNGQKEEPLKLGREQAKIEPITDLQLLERNALKYKKRGNIYLVIGAASFVAGVATFTKLGIDYKSYNSEIRKTNDAYISWYQTNYGSEPPAGDLQKKEGFGVFASPGIYAGAAALAGSAVFELIGLRNLRLARNARKGIIQKKKELSLQPFYEPSHKASGLSVALSF